jgi:hypothetical protein
MFSYTTTPQNSPTSTCQFSKLDMQKGRRAYENKDCCKGKCPFVFHTINLKNLPLTEKSTEFTPNIILSLL